MPKIAEIESTPNPNAIKFVLKEPLTFGVKRSYDSAAAAANDTLAATLFGIPHVTNVFYMDHWVTVTQDGAGSWPELLKQLAVPIRAAQPASAQTAEFRAAPPPTIEDPRLAAISALIDEKIRPYLMSDGGDLQLLDLDGNLLKVRYHGACGSCPSSLSGTLSAIENLVHSIEPNIEVVAE